MTGSTWLALHVLVLFLLVVWMAKRIVRGSRTLAIAVLCVWPLSIVALVRNWGQPATDIRLPFFLALFAAALLVVKAQTMAPDPVAAHASTSEIDHDYTERQLEVIARDQPEFVARVREARRAAQLEASAMNDPEVFYEDLFDEDEGDRPEADRIYLVNGDLSRTGYETPAPGIEQVLSKEVHSPGPTGSTHRAFRTAPVPGPARGADAAREAKPEPEVSRTRGAAPSAPEVRWSTRGALTHRPARRRQDEASLRSAARKLSYQFGTVSLVEAHASLQLPSGFRFVPGYSLPAMSRALGRPFDRDTTLGWVVQESVDIAADDAWYVEVEFLKTGLLRPPRRMDLLLPRLAGNALADGSRRRFGTDLLAPAWLPEEGVATWGVHTGPDSHPRAEILAVMPLRHGVLIYVMHQVPPERFEFALRTTRQLALQTRVEKLGQPAQFDPVRDRIASKDFLAWMRGESLEPGPQRSLADRG